MTVPNKEEFLQLWPKCFVLFIAIVELIAVIGLFLTELGNVAANFWLTNVFAGGWCGIVILIHFFFLFAAGCCAPGPKLAYYATIIAFVGLIACAALISFDAVFIALPTTCILTPSCATNAVSNDTFSYTFRQSFFTVFNSWSPFKTYNEPQVKFLCQTVQLGIGGLCFLTCIIYVITYYVTASKTKQQVGPHSPPKQPGYYAPQQQQQQSYYGPPSPAPQGYYQPPPQGVYPSLPQQQHYQPSAPVGYQPAYVPQGPGNTITLNVNRRY